MDARVEPVCATYWEADATPHVLDPNDDDDLIRLGEAFQRERTLWIETLLGGLSKEQDVWLKGEFDVWKALPTPLVDWAAAGPVLKTVGLETPTPAGGDGESAPARLLRALPYAYTRGAFGTVRDVLYEGTVAAELATSAPNRRLTLLPTTGFVPGTTDSGHVGLRYTVLHSTVGVIGPIVVSVRLPDAFCPDADVGDGPSCQVRLIPAEVLRRFLPQGRMPNGREVAEAIGMHQATTARSVASRIRESLKEVELLALRLNSDEDDDEGKDQGDDEGEELDTAGEGGDRAKRQRDTEVIRAATTIDGLAEIAHQLDRHLSTILRRFGGKLPDAPRAARELVPPEVKRRYRFALDNVHLLHEDCRLASQVVRQALAVYERNQREQFQFVAALLASIVLIPTLITGVFGANLEVPAKHSDLGFPAFVLVLVLLAGTGGLALRRAWKRGWHPEAKEFIPFAVATIAILVLFAGFLVSEAS